MSALVVHQHQVLVEHTYRNEEGAWYLEFVHDGVVMLRCPDVQLQLTDMYENRPLPENG